MGQASIRIFIAKVNLIHLFMIVVVGLTLRPKTDKYASFSSAYLFSCSSQTSGTGSSCFAVLPFPRHVLTAGILPGYLTSSVP